MVEFPNGQPVIVAPGNAVLLVDGQELGLQVTPRGGDGLSITGQGVALTMTATTSDGAPRPLADDGTLVVAHLDRLTVSGDGFGPQQPVEMWAFSTPLALGSTTTDTAGALSVAVTIPEALAPGTHTLQLVGLDSESALRTVSLGLTVTEAQEEPTDTSVPTTEPPVTQPPTPDPNPAEPEPAPDVPASPQPGDPYSALDNPEDLVENAVTAVAVLAAASAAGAAAGAAGAAARSSTPGASGGGSSSAASDEVGYVEAVGSMHLEANVEDRTASRWQWIANWPATQRLDQLTRSVLQWSAPKSPLLERVVGDGSTWRALFGSASLLLTATGAVLGVLASIDIGGEATPPALALMTALMIVGTMDALAGSVGFLVIAGSVIASGGVENAWDVRTLLGLAAAFVGPGLVAKAFRPLRRPPSTTLADWWERLADLAIAPLMGGLVAQGIVWGLNGMAGVYLPITDYTNRLALWVTAALAVQVLAEEAAARWFPARIIAVTPEDYPDPSTLRQAISVLISAATYVFVVIAFLGNTWQLWAAVALYSGPVLLGFIADRFPNSPVLWRVLPQGTPYMVVLLWMGATLAVWVEQWLGATPDYARTSFVVLAGFPALLALLALVGREPAEGEMRWNERPSLRHAYRLGGVVTLWVGIQTMV